MSHNAWSTISLYQPVSDFRRSLRHNPASFNTEGNFCSGLMAEAGARHIPLMFRRGSINWSKPNSPIVCGGSTDRFRIIGLTYGTRNIDPIGRAYRGSLLQSAEITTDPIPIDSDIRARPGDAADLQRRGQRDAVNPKVVHGPNPAVAGGLHEAETHLCLTIGLRQTIFFQPVGLCLIIVDTRTEVGAEGAP